LKRIQHFDYIFCEVLMNGGGGMIEIVPKVLVELGIRRWRQIQGPNREWNKKLLTGKVHAGMKALGLLKTVEYAGQKLYIHQ
jgi:hypothetical protein